MNLFNHQRQTANDIISKPHGILAWHLMGTGKTLTILTCAVAHLSSTVNANDVVILTTENNLVKDFSTQIEKIYPNSNSIHMSPKFIVRDIKVNLPYNNVHNPNLIKNNVRPSNIRANVSVTKRIIISTMKECARYIERGTGEFMTYMGTRASTRTRAAISLSKDLFDNRFVIIDECDKLLHCETMGYKTRKNVAS